MKKIWKERDGRAFGGVDVVNDFDLIRSRWFQALAFFLLGFMEDLDDLIDIW